MREFVEKLSGRKQSSDVKTSNSAIFGSSGANRNAVVTADPNLRRFRIGLWPIMSDTVPETAMGLEMALALLLERWESIRTYRLLADVDGDPREYEWVIEDSQFEVDDWELEDLDENVAIWGNLEKKGSQYELKLGVENDLSEEEAKEFTYSAVNLAELVDKLFGVSKDITDYLEAGTAKLSLPPYKKAAWDEVVLQEMLAKLFHWERNVYLALWGKPWSEEQIQTDITQIASTGEGLKSELGAWLTSATLARALSMDYEPLSNVLEDAVDDIAEKFIDYPITAIMLGAGLFRENYTLRAYDLMELSAEAHPENQDLWLALAELYSAGKALPELIDTLQRAIEADAASTNTYLRYAEVMILLDADNMVIQSGTERKSVTGRSFVEGFVLVDPDEVKSQPILMEAIESFRMVLKTEPENVEALSQLALQWIDLENDDELWSSFERLVKADAEGEHIRSVVDGMYSIEEAEPGIEILEKSISQNPTRLDLSMSLAALYLLVEDGDAARKTLEQASKLAEPHSQASTDIARMMLSADDPDFEAHLREIADRIDARNELTGDDVEFLEEALDNAPSFAPGYLLLASAYLGWDEDDDALEVLLDGQKHVPDNPDLIAMLARVLWDSGEENLAFDYLNKGLVSNPNHVTILALTGRYLFDDGQEETAKEFLTRAEAIDPRNSTLNETRLHIARSVQTGHVDDEE